MREPVSTGFGRRTGRSRLLASRRGRFPVRLPALPARSTDGRKCRSQWKQFPGCS
ncbi:hypothetical protein MCHI_000992 [Candidatus Magnetoovum chiemensis]|nr:hypothetical protein MCHI_000992 [Candidatus Magnetoovum chiemensis]